MDPYVAPYLRTLEDLRRQAVETVAVLSDEQINRTVPGLENTVGILLKHMAGAERYWIGEVAGGRPAHRNRDAEFVRTPVRKEDALAEIERAAAVSRAVLDGLSRDELLQEVEVRRARVVKDTRAGALLHATQHLAYHVGQLKYLAKLVQAG